MRPLIKHWQASRSDKQRKLQDQEVRVIAPRVSLSSHVLRPAPPCGVQELLQGLFDQSQMTRVGLENMHGGIIWRVWGNFVKPLTPRKNAFFQREGRKRVKEWREATFMKKWVKPLYIGYLQALDLCQNLFPFPRTSHLTISWGPT